LNLFGLTANIIDACFLIFGKTGKFLNARGNRLCFILDIICLTYWFFMDIQRGLISQGMSCLVSICIAIYGFRRWGKNPPVSKKVDDV
jgi:nicotinamide riboside transporter PnuC